MCRLLNPIVYERSRKIETGSDNRINRAPRPLRWFTFARTSVIKSFPRSVASPLLKLNISKILVRDYV